MDLQAALGRAGLVVILANSGPAATSGQRLDQPHIVVSVVNEAGVSPRIISDGQLRITAIYEAIGVAVTWVDTYLDVPNVCVVKIVDEVGADGVNAPPDVVGMGFTNQESGGGLVYVFYDRIAQVSEGNQLDSAALLGAVIAHELGHLLLPSGSHSTRGLMRAGWNRSDILTADGLRFTAEQGVRIRARLESRTQGSVWAAHKI